MLLIGVLFLIISFVTAILFVFFVGFFLIKHGISEFLVCLFILESLTVIAIVICSVFNAIIT